MSGQSSFPILETVNLDVNSPSDHYYSFAENGGGEAGPVYRRDADGSGSTKIDPPIRFIQ